MKPAAIVSLLWEKNLGVLEAFARRHPEVHILILSRGLSAAACQRLVAGGVKLVALDGLLDEAAQQRAAEAVMAGLQRMQQNAAAIGEHATHFSLDGSTFCRVIGELAEKTWPAVAAILEALALARQAYDLRLVAVNEDYTELSKAVVLWAGANRVPSLHLAHALALADPYTVHRQLNADLIALIGERGGEGYLDAGFARERLRVTGNPAWDHYPALRRERVLLRRQLAEQYGFDGTLPLLVFGTTWAANFSALVDGHAFASTLRTFLSSVAQLQQQGVRFTAVVKDRPSNQSYGANEFERVLEGCGVDRRGVRYASDTPDRWLVAADAVVSVDSNLTVEAMSAGVPAINLMNDSGLRMGPSFGAYSGVIEVAADELAAAMGRVLTDKAFAKAVVDAASRQLPYFNAGHDGRATERVAALMSELAAVSQHRFVWQSHLEFSDTDIGHYHDTARVELIALLQEEPTLVVEIGCGTGATGAEIKRRYPQAVVYGIEANRQAAELAASRIDRVLCGRFEDFDLAREGLSEGTVDLVIVADVLEHMYNPWRVLVELRRYLKPGGKVLASIPNTRNLTIIDSLSKGNWRYEAEGLLDVTHIRFFTKAEVERFFAETGYRITEMRHRPDGRLYNFYQQNQGKPNLQIKLDRMTLNDVTQDELVELCTLQFLTLAEPLPAEELPQTAPQPTGTSQNAREADPYRQWLNLHQLDMNRARLFDQRMASWPVAPHVHVLVRCASQEDAPLVRTIGSLATQLYHNVTLTVLADFAPPRGVPLGERISWQHVESAQGTARLSELACESTADWIAVVDAGDEVLPHTFLQLLESALENPGWHLLYSDEDRVTGDKQYGFPLFKPDFNLDYLRSLPYIGGLVLVRQGLLRELGGFDPQAGLGWHYDFVLRCFEHCGAPAIGHVAEVLYHKGGHGAEDLAQVADLRADQIAAVERHLHRLGVMAEVGPAYFPLGWRVRYWHPQKPLVSIIIPTRDQLDFLRRCIETLLEKTAYPHYEIIVVDNDSRTPEAQHYLSVLAASGEDRLKVLRYPHPFNYSAMNNLAAQTARGDYLLLLNNDTAILQPEWLDMLMEHAQRPEVGITGARLLFPDGTIQHAGVVLGMLGPAEHPGLGASHQEPGYLGRLHLDQDFSAVTGACLLVRRSVYEEVGGLDETAFEVSYNDIDLCLKVRQLGYLVVWTPYATLMHEGSASQKNRKVEVLTQETKQKRFRDEQVRLYRKWLPQIARDPAHNPNLTLRARAWEYETRPPLMWRPASWRPLPVVLAHPADAMGCGHYRIIHPLHHLNEALKIEGYASFELFQTAEAARLKPDTLLVQRQITAPQIEVLRNHRDCLNTFIVYELDDYLPNLPLKSAHRKDMPKDVIRSLRRGLDLCDRFVVSTEALAEAFSDYHRNTVVVHNSLPPKLWGQLQGQRRTSARPRVGWAGGASHTGDLELIADIVKELAFEVDWVFMGMCPDKLKPYIREFHGGVPIEQYPAKLASLNLDLALAPLENNLFNRCKSNLRLLEYGACGFPVICTDIAPYQGDLPVTRVRNKHKDWIDAIRAHLADLDATARQGDALQAAVRERWLLQGDRLDAWVRAWLP
ncbi:glycosyltransferase [Parachitinimonas caeni]|uniref:Glycosyltransferase n=1 Tax=Parachitinimonas caeni TaxID=3031301 RepID=A0ABT7E263_9NEIS|nr:glycosyltransferase [Parachitinimonas caeni]MDK2126394.1 glycosyltransferase [Parachitinimonas caeni]